VAAAVPFTPAKPPPPAAAAELEAEYLGADRAPVKDIPRPPHYRLTPRLVVFWKGRKSRVHDRPVSVLDHSTTTGTIQRPL